MTSLYPCAEYSSDPDGIHAMCSEKPMSSFQDGIHAIGKAQKCNGILMLRKAHVFSLRGHPDKPTS